MSNANALRGEISSTLCLGIFFYPHPFLSVLFTGSPYEATTSKTSTTTTTIATATVEGNPSVPVKGNNTNAFFENTLSNVNQTIEVTCCHLNKSIEFATCGLGASCEGKCSAVDAALCPSGRCTGYPEDCEYDFETPEEEETSPYQPDLQAPSDGAIQYALSGLIQNVATTQPVIRKRRKLVIGLPTSQVRGF